MARRNSRSVTESIVKYSGRPSFLGVLVATTSVTNHTTAAPFNNTGNALLEKVLILQPDTQCYVKIVSANNGVATTGATSDSMLIQPFERVIITMDDLDRAQSASGEFFGWIACVASAGTTNLKVWELV